MLGIRIRTTVLTSTFIVALLSLVPQITSAQDLPHPFSLAVRSAVLVDANTGQFLYGQNPDERIKPASFAKLLTLFLVFDAIEQGQIALEDKVWISEKAWRTGGSKMFVRQGDRIPLVQLIKGIAVVSGNDACVAVAEFIQGDEQTFVEKMNQKLRDLGLENSHFETVSGLPAPDQYTTARDMALLAQAYVRAHPEALQYHKIKEFMHENIRQKNRNKLLWRDDSVDGLKTGHTEDAGYHLLTTAKREDQRFIAVVMGAKNNALRERESLRLLNYGFRNFVSVRLFKQGDVLAQLSVWKGNEGKVELLASEPGVVTVPIAKQADISWQAKVPERLFAPIERGQSIGEAVIGTKDEVFKTVDLIADRDIPLAGFFRQAAHSAALIAKDHALTLIFTLIFLAGLASLALYLKRRKPKKGRRRNNP